MGFTTWLQTLMDANKEAGTQETKHLENKLGSIKGNAAEAFFKKAKMKGIAGSFNFWKSLMKGAGIMSLEAQNEELNETLFMLKHNAADMSSRKSVLSWMKGSLMSCMWRWKEYVALKWQRSHDMLEGDLHAMKRNAAQVMSLKVKNRWRFASETSAFNKWKELQIDVNKMQLNGRYDDIVALVKHAADDLGFLLEPVAAYRKKLGTPKRRTATRRVRRVRKMVRSPPMREIQHSRNGMANENDEECQLLLKMSMGSIREGTKQRSEFERQFVEDVSISLGCDENQIEFIDVSQKGARLLARFIILAALGKQEKALTLAKELERQCHNHGSDLYQGEVTWRIDKSFEDIRNEKEERESEEDGLDGYESYYSEEEYFLDEVKGGEYHDDGAELVEQTLGRLVNAVKRYHKEAQKGQGGLQDLQEKAAGGYASRVMRAWTEVSLRGVFNDWKQLSSGGKMGNVLQAMENLKHELWMLQVKACTTLARRVFNSWSKGASADAFGTWSGLVSTLKKEKYGDENERMKLNLHGIKMNAAQMMARNVIGKWRSRSMNEIFHFWKNLMQKNHVEEMGSALEASLIEAEELKSMVAKLQKKLDKATSEKKALLDEVNRHVGLLL